MATNRRLRRPPPPPPPPPEDDVHSSEESAGEDQLDQHQSFSNDDGSDSEQVQTTPLPPHPSADPATIHPPPVAIHPAPSTGSDEDEEDDSGDDVSESDQEQITPNKPHSPSAPATASDDDGSDDGDDSEEEDSESEPSTPLPSPSAAVARTVPVPAFASDNDDITGAESGQDELEIEKEQSGGGETSKKLFERVWSDEDQITLLTGIIDYSGSHQGKNPMANTEDLWLFLNEKLSCRVTKKQLIRKIRQVKAKYVKNQKRKRPFNTPYDAEVFKLSEKLWEETLLGENGGFKKRKRDESEEEEAVADDYEVLDEDEKKWEDYIVSLSMNHMSWTEQSARAKIKSLDGSVRKLMVQDWKKLKKDQVRCISNRLSLKGESMATIFGQRS